MKRVEKLYGERPAAFDDERYDCAVRAIRVATGLPYERVHKVLGRLGRKPRDGTPGYICMKACEQLCGTKVELEARLVWRRRNRYLWGEDVRERRYLYPTLAAFLRQYPKGRYVVRQPGHLFAVVDGVVHNWSNGRGARSRITWAYRMPEMGLDKPETGA